MLSAETISVSFNNHTRKEVAGMPNLCEIGFSVVEMISWMQLNQRIEIFQHPSCLAAKRQRQDYLSRSWPMALWVCPLMRVPCPRDYDLNKIEHIMFPMCFQSQLSTSGHGVTAGVLTL
jgi:hypothetical protein